MSVTFVYENCPCCGNPPPGGSGSGSGSGSKIPIVTTPCAGCDQAPTLVKVVLSGCTDDGPDPATSFKSSWVNGTYFLPGGSSGVPGPGTGVFDCVYGKQIEGPNPGLGALFANVTFHRNLDGTITITVYFLIEVGGVASFLNQVVITEPSSWNCLSPFTAGPLLPPIGSTTGSITAYSKYDLTNIADTWAGSTVTVTPA